MKIIRVLTLLFVPFGVTFCGSGCVVTGQLAYTDPATGATANIGVSQNIDGKTIKRLRN